MALFFLLFLALLAFLAYKLVSGQVALKQLLSPDYPDTKLPQLSLAAVTILVITYNIFIHNAGPVFPTLGYAIFNLSLTLSLLLTLDPKKRSPFTYLLAITNVLAPALSLYRANAFVQSTNYVFHAITLTSLLFIHAMHIVN